MAVIDRPVMPVVSMSALTTCQPTAQLAVGVQSVQQQQQSVPATTNVKEEAQHIEDKPVLPDMTAIVSVEGSQDQTETAVLTTNLENGGFLLMKLLNFMIMGKCQFVINWLKV